MPKVFLLILNWNKPLDTIECIDSCLKLDYDNYEILVVDNHSVDDSVAQFRSRYPKLHLIVNSENLGYAGGNNVGIEYILKQNADFILILNNDTTLDPYTLTELVAAAQSNPRAGLIAPKVLYYDDPSLINSLGTSMDWFRMRPYLGECNQKDTGNYSPILRKDILVGCALLVPKKTIERIGMIDEKFFLIHEEADWCFRNLSAGLENLVVSKAVLYHKVSKAFREFSALAHYYSTRNFLYLARRNASLLSHLRMYCGLAYYVLKHIPMFFSKDIAKQKLAQAFFAGLKDYYSDHMGKCMRTF